MSTNVISKVMMRCDNARRWGSPLGCITVGASQD
jgi:hypothetical protein